MSWLSSALKRNHLDFVNQLAKPVVQSADKFVRDVVPGGGAILDIGNAVGNFIPQVGGGVSPNSAPIAGGSDPTDVGQSEWEKMLAGLPKQGTSTGTGTAASPATDWLSKVLGGAGKTLSGATGSDWLKAIGGAGSAALDYKARQDALNQAKEQFNRTTGNTEAQTAANAQHLLNRAPMADQAQYLLRARMGAAPTTFAPRDFTRTGLSQATMSAPAMGGPQTQLAAGQQAAASYTPNAGGVDTSVLEMLKKRMLGNSGMAG